MSAKDEKADSKTKGRPLSVDADAVSASQTAPAFVARPIGAPVYYGFEVTDITVDGFTYGKITDFEAGLCQEGDAFVVAPDGSRAGLNWCVSQKLMFKEVLPPTKERWGVWDVNFPYPMSSRENVRKNMECSVPLLKAKWAEWRQRQDG